MTKNADSTQTDIYKSRSWVSKFPNRGWLYIGIEISLLALVLYYGSIHSVEDLGVMVILLVILTAVGLWNIFKHINASITSEGVHLNQNLLDRRKTIEFDDISDVSVSTGSVYSRMNPMRTLYYLAGDQTICIKRVQDVPVFVSVSNADEFVAMFEAMRAAYGLVFAYPLDDEQE